MSTGCQAREDIETAHPWENQAAFGVTSGWRMLELCVLLDTTRDWALYILIAEEAQR